MHKTLILGAGVTGLGVAYASGFPIYEASAYPGGICSTYYLRKGSSVILHERSEDAEDYRFEIGGGHWIFGIDDGMQKHLSPFANFRSYQRQSSVFFPKWDLYVPFPVQYHLSRLPSEIAERAAMEITNGLHRKPIVLSDWLLETFGRTLYELFFLPFHELYTAGFTSVISPEDSYKTPIDREKVLAGLKGKSSHIGYNTTFLYPEGGLGKVFSQIAEKCNIQFNSRVVGIDRNSRKIHIKNGESFSYDQIISTLPLNEALQLVGLVTRSLPDPYTSVFVLNIGADRGEKCPEDHWIYIPESRSNFYRVGFYSNVESEFLPIAFRRRQEKVSLYVERAFRSGTHLSLSESEAYVKNVITELQDWGFIGAIDVVNPTWIEVAYTWKRPGSNWVEEGIQLLKEYGINSVGRYGKWRFQGIADSLREGIDIGRKFDR